MIVFVVAAILVALALGLLVSAVNRAAPGDRLRAAGRTVGMAFLLCHGFQVFAAVRLAEARENLALLGPRATPRDEAFGLIQILQPSFAGLLMLSVVVLAAGILTVGRGLGPRLPRLLGVLALLIAVPMALGSLPVPGPAPGTEVVERALPDDLHPLFRAVAWERRFGAALPLLVVAAAWAVLRARRERFAALASGTPEEREDARRVQVGAGLLLFATSGMLAEALALVPCMSAVRWGPSARTGWDLFQPWVLVAVLPALACGAGLLVVVRHGYRGLRKRGGGSPVR